MSDVQVKICGLSTPAQVSWAVAAGARYIGLMFYPKSPRNVSVETARALALEVPAGVAKVAVTVNADDATLDAITARVPLDMLQLHGGETPERVAAVRARYGLPVMKVVGVAGPEDLAGLDRYNAVADQLLVETKQPKDAALPGGMGVPFDWTLVQGHHFQRPWMLAGGLTPANVATAIRVSGARQVDVSSGVESAPGKKDEALIRAFLEAVA